MKKIAIVMGSDSDYDTMKPAVLVAKEFGFEIEVKVLSAHRTPFEMLEFGRTAHQNGFGVIIAGAGGAAHLPGMLAAASPLPVIGVPVKSKTMSGLDSLYSIVQMPGGVPVATVAIGGGRNAGILAAQILATGDNDLLEKIIAFKETMAVDSRLKNESPDFGKFSPNT